MSGPELLAKAIYQATEWSGCNGSRWERLTELWREQRIANARSVLAGLATEGYIFAKVEVIE